MDTPFPSLTPGGHLIWAQQLYEVKVSLESGENKFLGVKEPEFSKYSVHLSPA